MEGEVHMGTVRRGLLGFFERQKTASFSRLFRCPWSRAPALASRAEGHLHGFCAASGPTMNGTEGPGYKNCKFKGRVGSRGLRAEMADRTVPVHYPPAGYGVSQGPDGTGADSALR